jgi:hypothetical protein
VDSDDVAVLDTKVVPHNTVDAGASVIKIVIGEDDQHSVLALLTLNENCVTTEELESLHGVVREGNHRVIIVNGIGNTAGDCQLVPETTIVSYRLLTSKSWASSSSSE